MRHNRKIIYLAGFLFSIPIALTSYINSSLLNRYMNEYYVSAIYALASFVTIFALIQMPKILARLGNRKTSLLFSVLTLVSFLLLALGNDKFIIVGGFILYFLANTIVGAALDIFVEDFSQNSVVGKFRGFYLTVLNVAWVIAQMISGSIIAKSSFRGIYIFSALFMILVSVMFVLFLRDFIEPKYKKVSVLKTLRLFLKNKHIGKIYILNFILQFFYAWMIIYMPIYLNYYLGFSWSQIGFIFTIMLLPFVLLSFPAGKISDKIGEKKMLAASFLIMALSTLIIPFITQEKVWMWALILFATRTGAAMISVLTDSYFFKVVTEENADLISFYRNTSPVSYIIAPLIAIPVLIYVPSFKYIFFVLGAIVLSGFFVSLRLKDVM